jgi:ribosomal protein S6--L-glutamate ligase
VGGRVVAAGRFVAGPGEWRSNAARGGRVEPWQPSAAEVALAVAAAAAVGLGVCGVDLLPGAGETVVGEVNPSPGFRHLEAATGIDVAGPIVEEMRACADRR